MFACDRLLFQGTLLGCALVAFLTHWIAAPGLPGPGHIDTLVLDPSSQRAAEMLSPLYPQSIQRWRPSIEQCADQYGLDPNLVAAVMFQESGGNPEAYSSSGAVGLMQVMPRDGLAASFICENGPCFADRPTSVELFDPQFNIDYGCRMLRGLINKQPTLRDALKAYGPKDCGYTYADLVISIYERFR